VASLAALTTILLARHGETDWNREQRFQGHADPPLNEHGKAQARELAETLADEPLDALYSSPLRRARETAEIVGGRLGLAVELKGGLREVDLGSWSGLTRTQVEELFPEGFRRWLDYGPGWDDGETYEQMGGRVVATLHELAAAHPEGRVLVVTHAGPVRAAVATSRGISIDDARRLTPTILNCAVTAVAVEDGRMRAVD
jgi:2,3-bisphosphoglycerate-dependent phosphoglycerate mutase